MDVLKADENKTLNDVETDEMTPLKATDEADETLE